MKFLSACLSSNRATQADHDSVAGLRLDSPLQRELWWTARLKVIRLHWTRGSLLISLLSVSTNQAAPPEDHLLVHWDTEWWSAWWEEEEQLKFTPTTTTFLKSWERPELCGTRQIIVHIYSQLHCPPAHDLQYFTECCTNSLTGHPLVYKSLYTLLFLIRCPRNKNNLV